MEKIKYLFVFLVALCFVPSMVSATQDVYYKDYKIGDEITVTLDKDGKVKDKFIVIEATPEGTDKGVSNDFDYEATKDYHSVTAIYAGTVGDVQYNDNGAYADDSGVITKTRDLGWINYEKIRLLKRDDLSNLIASLPEAARDEIYGRSGACTNTENGNSFSASCPTLPIGTMDMTAVKKYLPFIFLENPYWVDEPVILKDICGEDSEYCKDVRAEHGLVMTSTGFKYLQSVKTAGLRPIITIHKGFVEGGMDCNCTDCEEETPIVNKVCPNDSKISIQSCIDGGSTEEACIKKLCSGSEEKPVNKVCPNDSKISIQSCIDGGSTEETCIKKLCPGSGKTENPKTGSYLSLFGIIIAAVVASCVYASTRNKNYFKKVK